MRTHIVFGASVRASLNQAFKVNQISEPIVTLEDDLMWGPLGDILLDHVQTMRLHWWEHVLNEEDKDTNLDYLRNAFKEFSTWANTVKADDSLLFWVGDSPTEFVGLMCVVTQMNNPASVVMVSPAYYQKYGKFRPRSAIEIVSEKLYPLIEDAKTISPRDRDRYITNWNQLLAEKSMLRIRKRRQAMSTTEDYYDEDIRSKKISKEKLYRSNNGFFPAARLVGEIYAHQRQYVMDLLIEWRIRCLIQKGLFQYEGTLASMRSYMIKPNVGGF